jgi:hypothetical protein
MLDLPADELGEGLIAIRTDRYIVSGSREKAMGLTTNEWIDLLGSTASVIVAFATLYTVLELKAQRRDAHRPEITPVRQLVEGKKPVGGPPWPWLTNWREPDVSKPSGDSAGIDYRIRLHNIGSGPAKNVTLTWDYPLGKLIQQINQVCQKGNQDFHIESEPDEFFISIKSIGGEKDGSFNRAMNMLSQKEYILPSSVEQQPSGISLPLAFILLNSICASLPGKTDLVLAVLEEVGKIGLRIEHYDMLDIKYINSFQCRIDYHRISSDAFFGELRFDRA